MINKWGCFHLKVTERQPRFVVGMNRKPWLVSDDGIFLRTAANAKEVEGMVRVEGVSVENTSPDIVRSRFEGVRDLVELIKNKSGQDVERVSVQPQNEAKVIMRGNSFPVLMNLPVAGDARSEDQVLRYARLMKEFSGRESQIQRLDLTLNRAAVVQLVP